MKDNKRMIKNKIDLLINDMGKASFLKLLHFMVEIMEDEHEIKILMVRRFLDLFLEFEEIVQYIYDGEVQKKGTFVTNLSVVLWKERLADKTILIVDDIRLHGRALDKIGKFLTDECHCAEENIALKVFADNRDAVKVRSKFYQKTEIMESVSEDEWKKVSSSIINSFFISGQPYISHLPYCEIPFGTDAARAVLDLTKSQEAEEITTEIQSYYKMRVYLCFIDSYMPFVGHHMIRIYIHERLQKIVVVPYAVLKPFSCKGIVSFCGVLRDSGLMPEEISADAVNEETVVRDRWLVKYLYSLGIYIASLLLGEKYLPDHGIKDVSWNKSIERYNLGYDIRLTDAVPEVLIEKLADAVKGEVADEAVGVELPDIAEIHKILQEMEEAGISGSSSDRFIERYMKFSGALDEKLAGRDEARMPGIEYLRLHQCLLGKTIRDVWKTIIRVVDSGRGTLTASFNNINQKSFINSLLYAGEQNFASNESNLIYFIYPLLEYECRLQSYPSSGTVSEEDLKKGKEELVQQIFHTVPELRDKVDAEELKNLTDKSIRKSGMKYYMGRYPVYENDSRLREILSLTRHYKRG